MKRFLLASAVLLLAASPAYALKITNLDDVPHMVELSGGGVVERRVIAPDATEIFPGAALGFLSLVDTSPAASKKSKKPTYDSVVHADGLLSGIIGNERTSGIPADPEYNYVIWDGGKLMVQSRTKMTHGR